MKFLLLFSQTIFFSQLILTKGTPVDSGNQGIVSGTPLPTYSFQSISPQLAGASPPQGIVVLQSSNSQAAPSVVSTSTQSSPTASSQSSGTVQSSSSQVTSSSASPSSTTSSTTSSTQNTAPGLQSPVTSTIVPLYSPTYLTAVPNILSTPQFSSIPGLMPNVQSVATQGTDFMKSSDAGLTSTFSSISGAQNLASLSTVSPSSLLTTTNSQNTLGVSTDNSVTDADSLDNSYSLDNLQNHITNAFINGNASSVNDVITNTIEQSIDTNTAYYISKIDKLLGQNDALGADSPLDPTAQSHLQASFDHIEKTVSTSIQGKIQQARDQAHEYMLSEQRWNALPVDEAKSKLDLLAPEIENGLRLTMAHLLLDMAKVSDVTTHAVDGAVKVAQAQSGSNQNKHYSFNAYSTYPYDHRYVASSPAYNTPYYTYSGLPSNSYVPTQHVYVSHGYRSYYP